MITQNLSFLPYFPRSLKGQREKRFWRGMYNVKERAPRLMEEEGSRGKSQKSTDANWRFRPGRVIKVSDPPSTHNLKFYFARNRSCCFLPLFFAGIALVAAILRRRGPGSGLEPTAQPSFNALRASQRLFILRTWLGAILLHPPPPRQLQPA